MRKAAICFVFCFAIFFSNAQPALVNEINRLNPPGLALAPLRFLASDELMGRATTRPEIQVAARYISEQFRSFGLKEMAGTPDYFQSFKLKIISPSTNGSIVVGNKTYYMGANLLQVRGTGLQLTAPVVFAGFGALADLAGLDVKDKIVVVNMGESDSTTVREANRIRDVKQRRLKEMGALALIERYWQPASDWELLKHYYSSQRAFTPQDELMPVFIIHDPAGGLPNAVKSSTTCAINATGSNL
ncbi:MAG: hypothetical protein Q8941_24235, partial [Bacteroidota bacterium]|nr:hypothetical protein [Bacteroidota bacterium]